MLLRCATCTRQVWAKNRTTRNAADVAQELPAAVTQPELNDVVVGSKASSSRVLWVFGRPRLLGAGIWGSRLSHSTSVRSVD